MRIYHSIEDFPSDVNTIVTIGTFDGVHKGHQIIINRINEIAKKEA
ncbi:MAG: adenylyltransferase/cytidyltransferase family protein, partial [Bacteroidetes bacterium]|nr:adenylyltransferase/cytidyltransferase family protein [Bacteroidota bacterium]